jgi:hypothetical protein
MWEIGSDLKRNTGVKKIDNAIAGIKDLEKEKRQIKRKIKAALKKLNKACGHPRVKQSSWGHAKCTVCGLFDRENFFLEFNPDVVILDIQGNVR